MKMHQTWLASVLAVLLAACGGASEDTGQGHEAHGEHAEEVAKGEHGGRLLGQDGYTVELGIAEEGTPPKFQAWLYEGDKPLPPTAGQVEVRVKRLGNLSERHALEPREEGSLLADTIVGVAGPPRTFGVSLGYRF